jgi:hypothetical protein
LGSLTSFFGGKSGHSTGAKGRVEAMSTIADEKFISAILGREDNGHHNSNGSDEIVCVDKFIGDDQMQLLMNRLNARSSSNSGQRRIRRLCLRGNCIGGGGAKAIAEMLRTNNVLEFLSLEWNQIGSSGCQSIADALRQNHTLKHLDLRNNGISDDGAIALAQAAAFHSSSGKTALKVLDLRWNQVERASLSVHTVFVNVRSVRRSPMSVPIRFRTHC